LFKRDLLKKVRN